MKNLSILLAVIFTLFSCTKTPIIPPIKQVKAPAICFEWSFTNNSTKEISSNGDSGTINWGDGTNSPIVAGTNNHAYAISGSYTVSIYTNGKFSHLILSNNYLTDFNPLILPSWLQVLGLSYNNLTTFAPYIFFPQGLQQIQLGDNKLTTFNPFFGLPSGLKNLDLDRNDLTGFDPIGVALPIGLTTLDVSGNKLNTDSVNSILIALNNIGYKATPTPIGRIPITLFAELSQNPAAPPTGAGIIAKDSLNARRCRISTN